MAVITVRIRSGTRHVTVRGALIARDLRRLERACGPALEQKDIHLELHVHDKVASDDAARLFLDRLVKRGAVLS